MNKKIKRVLALLCLALVCSVFILPASPALADLASAKEALPWETPLLYGCSMARAVAQSVKCRFCKLVMTLPPRSSSSC